MFAILNIRAIALWAERKYYPFSIAFSIDFNVSLSINLSVVANTNLERNFLAVRLYLD